MPWVEMNSNRGGVASRFLQSSDVEEVRWVSNLNGPLFAIFVQCLAGLVR